MDANISKNLDSTFKQFIKSTWTQYKEIWWWKGILIRNSKASLTSISCLLGCKTWLCTSIIFFSLENLTWTMIGKQFSILAFFLQQNHKIIMSWLPKFSSATKFKWADSSSYTKTIWLNMSRNKMKTIRSLILKIHCSIWNQQKAVSIIKKEWEHKTCS